MRSTIVAAWAMAAVFWGAVALGQAVGTGVPIPRAPVVDSAVAPEADPAEHAAADPFLDESASGDASAPHEPSDMAGCGSGKCGTGCGIGGGYFASQRDCMRESEPLTLWSMVAPCTEQCYGITAGGWIQFGYTTEGANGDGTGLFNNYPNTVPLQQAWIYVDKSIDDDRCDAMDWGFHFDVVYGTDGQDTQAFFGRTNEWDKPWDHGHYYGVAIPQLYGEVAYNDLKVKLGHFYTICGYEVVQAPENFFYSHAFTMVQAEPFTHTGILAEYGMNDQITLWGGWTAGWDTGFTRNHGDTFLGGVSVQLLDRVTATYTTTMGNFGVGPGLSDDDGYSHSIVVDAAITDRLNYVFQSDYVDNDLFFGGTIPAGLDKAWGINQYLLYRMNDCVGAGARLEYFDQEASEVTAATVGLNLKPHANVILRPEIRFEDWSPGNLLGRRDSTILAMDMIMTF